MLSVCSHDNFTIYFDRGVLYGADSTSSTSTPDTFTHKRLQRRLLCSLKEEICARQTLIYCQSADISVVGFQRFDECRENPEVFPL